MATRLFPGLRRAIWRVVMVLIALTMAVGIWATPHARVQTDAAVFPGVPTVGALLVKGRAKPFCTASVVWSPRGDVLLTAAHCLGRRRNITFAPAYRHGRAPLGTWDVTREIVPAGWFPRRNADSGVNIDFAFLVVHGDVQRVTGAEIVSSSSPVPALVRVVGYVNNGDRYPVTCMRRPETIMVQGQRQLKFVCGGYVGAASGAPFLVGKKVVGVIGGYQHGGIWRSVSYSSPFGPAMRALYIRAALSSSSSPVQGGMGRRAGGYSMMTSVSIERFGAEISASTATLASIIDGADLTKAVPTCPDWTLRQLATHVGRAHRWAAEIVATRSAEFIPFRAVPDGRIPDDPARHAGWLHEGAERLVTTVREAGADPVWAFARLRPASFWARRMAHETAVHRTDAEIAAGRVPVIDADIAVDGIDEWFGYEDMLDGGQGSRLGALADGQVLHLHATDEGLGGAGEWLVRRVGDRITVDHGHGKGDAAVRGPASALILVLVRRLPPEDAPVEVIGDRAVLDQWLAATPF